MWVLISISLGHLSRFSGTVPKAFNTFFLTVTFMLDIFVISPAIYSGFFFILFGCGLLKLKNQQVLIFLLIKTNWDLLAGIAKNNLSLFFKNSFWIVSMPFVEMLIFQSLSQFAEAHLFRPVISVLILLLCWIAALRLSILPHSYHLLLYIFFIFIWRNSFLQYYFIPL